jgi:predicted MPP superfamily phosphohydrolase
MRQAADLESDLIAITGDIADRRACLEWLPETLATLEARWGKFFVLGNHDLRFGDPGAVRRAMEAAGFVDLGGRSCELLVGGALVRLAGNELPWIRSAADVSHWPSEAEADRPPRILLAHTPDQLAWARRRDFDLMLAGHMHGGQIRLPWIGPIVSPSYRGTRYASGTFYEPPTLMHVSRGIASLQTVRWNCPPELTRLVLRSPHAGEANGKVPTRETDAVQ